MVCWNSTFEKVKLFKETTGFLPTEFTERSLYGWCFAQKSFFVKNTLSVAKTLKLESIGINFENWLKEDEWKEIDNLIRSVISI